MINFLILHGAAALVGCMVAAIAILIVPREWLR